MLVECFLFLVVRPGASSFLGAPSNFLFLGAPSSFLLLGKGQGPWPGAPTSFLFLVVRPGATNSDALVTSSDALCY